MSRSILWFNEIGQAEAAHVGGKGLNLGLMTAAGLPVPPGFVITQEAYREAQAAHERLELSGPLSNEILAAYTQLDRGLVAVRSSAIGEDGAELSFAGQQETILGVEGDDQLLAAVLRCWQSLHGERAIAYRRANQIDDASVTMAVVVQRLVPSDVSGVLFTQDPIDSAGERLLIEAAPGLGEAVVSGRVMPDRFHVDRATGTVVDQTISTKTERLSATGWSAIPPEEQQQPCLSPEQLSELAALSAKIEAYYGAARDVEWAFADGELFILQARPITTGGAAEMEQIRREEIERVETLAAGQEVIWARYNLAEVLPAPTPLTWSVVKHFMSGEGGFGEMFRSLGYEPDPELDDAGFLDLICGRPYVNLDREPKLFFRDFPYGYDFAAIRAQPELGMYPKLVTQPHRKTSRFWWRLPMIVWRMLSSTARIKRAMLTEADHLTNEAYPKFVAAAHEHRKLNLAALPYAELLDQYRVWTGRLREFARHSLRPGVLAATALAELEQLLTSAGVLNPDSAARQLVMGVKPPPDSDLAGALRQLAEGRMPRDEFLLQFGHRGPQEMELAQPRWSESPNDLPLPGSTVAEHSESKSAGLEDLVDLKKHAALRPRLEQSLRHARQYLALRESSKHYLMLGFELLRAIFRELGRRIGVGDGIFYLQLADLPADGASANTEALLSKLKAAQRRRKLVLTLPTPPVLFSDDAEAIGRPIPVTGAAEWNATPLSFGEFEGPALVLAEPIDADQVAPGFVLVCPSTDPAWVPLFLKAGALVMESGGVLSHGAIVAREFGIPAVAGIANVHRRLVTGQRLKVDGTSGKVHVYDA